MNIKFNALHNNEVLSLFSKVFFDVLTNENYKKKQLSKLLSSSFETKNISTLSKKIYQYFTQYSY